MMNGIEVLFLTRVQVDIPVLDLQINSNYQILFIVLNSTSSKVTLIGGGTRNMTRQTLMIYYLLGYDLTRI